MAPKRGPKGVARNSRGGPNPSKSRLTPLAAPQRHPHRLQVPLRAPFGCFVIVQEPARCPFWVSFEPPSRAKMCFRQGAVQILHKSPSGAPVRSEFRFGVAFGPSLARKWNHNGSQKGWLDTFRGPKTTKISPDSFHTPTKTPTSAQSPFMPRFGVELSSPVSPPDARFGSFSTTRRRQNCDSR